MSLSLTGSLCISPLAFVAHDMRSQQPNIYGASKAFVHQFSLNLRADLADKNIRVTSLEPGAAETEFSIVRFDGDKEKAKKTYNGFDPIESKNIAEIIEFIIRSPLNININRIEVMSNHQSFAGFNFIKK